jgi:hypothetical protein
MTNKELRDQIKLYLDGKIDLWHLCDWIYNRVHTIDMRKDTKEFMRLYTTPLHAQCLFNDKTITLFEAHDMVKKEFFRKAN